ncbi:MAG: phosphomethylpyrimidine kinase, partial [Clostridia bacterium]
YTSAPISREELKSYLSKLSFLGPNYVVITGVTLSSGKICNVGFDKSSSDYWCSYYKPLPEVYPGMGDVFTAVLVGSILQGNSFALSIETATRYIETTALTTFSYKTPVRDGLLLEATLGWLGKEHFFNEYEKI